MCAFAAVWMQEAFVMNKNLTLRFFFFCRSEPKHRQRHLTFAIIFVVEDGILVQQATNFPAVSCNVAITTSDVDGVLFAVESQPLTPKVNRVEAS